MLAKYCRFYRATDEDVMRMPIKRFFALYGHIDRLHAEETLTNLRVISHPYMDNKNGDDKFVENLQRMAQMNGSKQSQDITKSFDFATWGIKHVQKGGK